MSNDWQEKTSKLEDAYVELRYCLAIKEKLMSFLAFITSNPELIIIAVTALLVAAYYVFSSEVEEEK